MNEFQAAVPIILALITGIFGIYGTRQQLMRLREQREFAREKAEAERKHNDNVARLEREKIKAEAELAIERALAEKARADAARIRNESEGELLKATAEANQMNQVSQLMLGQQLMLTDAFKQISQDSAQSRVVYDRVAENLGKQTEAIAMVATTFQVGQSELKTELEGMSAVIMQAVRDFPHTVDVKVSPIGGQLRQIQEMLARLTHLVQGAQLTLLVNPPLSAVPLDTNTPITNLET